MRQSPDEGVLSLPERSALKGVELGGPTTVTALAKAEDMSVQSMGATLAGLKARGLLESRPDPDDGRRYILAITEAGRAALGEKSNTRTEQMAQVLSTEFTEPELRKLMEVTPLIDRLAQEI
jgi:DNA-binding MarR family transcriptional regulator